MKKRWVEQAVWGEGGSSEAVEAIATDSDSGRCWIGNAKAILKAIFFGAGQAAIPLVAKRMARTHLTVPAGLE